MSIELSEEQRVALRKFGADERKLIDLFLTGLENSQLGHPHIKGGKPVGLDFSSVRVTDNSEEVKKIAEGFAPATEWKARGLPAATRFVCFETTGARAGCLLAGHFSVDQQEPRLVRIGEHPITRRPV